jgi:hypothetical protein
MTTIFFPGEGQPYHERAASWVPPNCRHLISNITYINLKKEGALVSLRARTGNIEPFDTLEEVWCRSKECLQNGVNEKCSDK